MGAATSGWWRRVWAQGSCSQEKDVRGTKGMLAETRAVREKMGSKRGNKGWSGSIGEMYAAGAPYYRNVAVGQV